MNLTAEVSRHRESSDPGGCQCMECDCIFIGDICHDVCGICYAKKKAITERRSNRKPAVTQKQVLDAMHDYFAALSMNRWLRGPEVKAKHAAVVALLSEAGLS